MNKEKLTIKDLFKMARGKNLECCTKQNNNENCCDKSQKTEDCCSKDLD